MMVTSRSPYRVSDRDLGMGVAVMTRRWVALPFSRNRARWTTPKRCCSSTTMSARSANAMSFCNRACVPTVSFIFPEPNPSSILARCAFRMRPVTNATSKPNGATSSRMVWACCSARISVGAIKAACAPLSAAHNMAWRATRVLPDPTSPCNRRCMATGRCKSWPISSMARVCACVSLKGRFATSCRVSGPLDARTRPGVRWRSFFACPR